MVSRSSAESKYRAMTQSVCEIMWISRLLMEVGIKTSIPAKLWCDNQTALHVTFNPVFHERTKLIICAKYVKTREQLSDIFTKAPNGDRVSYLCNKLGMINIYVPT